MNKFLRVINSWRPRLSLKQVMISGETGEHIAKTRIICPQCNESSPLNMAMVTQDKHLSYHIMSELGIPIPKQYFAGLFNVHELLEIKVPYTIKATHGFCGEQVKVVQNNHLKALQSIHSTFTLNGQSRMVIAEEYMSGPRGEFFPYDYKAFVFNGVVEYIFVRQMIHKSGRTDFSDMAIVSPEDMTASRRNGFTRRVTTFDKYGNETFPLWNFPKVPRIETNSELLDRKKLECIKEYCSRLSIFGNMCIRVDFVLNNDDELVFGEFTPHPNAGRGFTSEFLHFADQAINRHNIPIRLGKEEAIYIFQ